MALHTIRSLFKRPPSTGDIGRLEYYNNYRDFLQNKTSKIEAEFLGLGNHEFYETTFNLGLEKAKQLGNEPCIDDPLILLHQRRYDIPFSRVIIIGCTLWPPIPLESTDIVHYKISDFQKIRGWSVEQHNKVHESDLAWLRGEIQTLRKTSQEKRSILFWDGVNVWGFGHTHFMIEFKERGIRVVSNQRGYVLPWKTKKWDFDVRRVVWV
ncbi:hypothetical protein N7453_000402 [Penicillium expansum]|nr:hypothetical protein N7453_000402 [Penicillium expansum]